MIAVIGGTGEEGLGLAMRFAAAGQEVVIGSRALERAESAAARVREDVAGAQVQGAANDAAVRMADTVVISVPYSGMRQTITTLSDALAGKLVINIVVPMEFGPGGVRAIAVAEGSAAEETKSILGEGTPVVGAFHNLSAHELMDWNKPIDADVIVCGGDTASRQQVMTLASLIKGCRGIDGGPLRNSRYVEEITVLLVGINRRYKTQAGIRIVGIP